MAKHWHMHRLSRMATLLLLAGAIGLRTSVGAATGTDALVLVREYSATAEIVFHGTSTLHDFEGRVMSQPFQLLLATNAWSAQAEVVAGEMTTLNTRRDRAMWTMLGTNLYPRLSGKFHAATHPSAGSNAVLTLRIRDHEIDLPVTITRWSETSDAVRFHAAWDVSLKEYGIKPPSVLGLIRVGDRVHLDAEVRALASPPAPPAPSPAAWKPLSK